MLEALILSGALIGLPARIADVFPERNALLVRITFNGGRVQLNVGLPRECPVRFLLDERQTVHFSQLGPVDGRLVGFAKECPI